MRNNTTYKYSKIVVYVIIICAAVLSGCETDPIRYRLDTPTYSEAEIRSKTWSDPEGRKFQCLKWQITEFKYRPALLIAQYGDSQTKIASCVEFYRVIDRAAGYVNTYDEDDRHFLAQKAFIPAKRSFGLIDNDFNDNAITHIEPYEVSDSVVGVRITREIHSDKSKMQRHISAVSTLQYTKNLGMSPDLHEYETIIPGDP